MSTTSPSIDIQISSNFERLVYDSCKDSKYIQEIMHSLKKEGVFNLSEKSRSYINNYFSSDTATEDEVKDIILQYYVDHDSTWDPHTAVGVSCGKKQSTANDILVTLSTAHPAKFKDTVSKIISNDSSVSYTHLRAHET